MSENIWTEIAEMNTDEIPAKIVISGYSITEEDKFFNSINIQTGCMQDGYISYGCTFSPSCSVNMEDHELIQNGVFFEVYFQIEGAWEHFGKYKITTEPRREQGTVEFSGQGMIASIFDNTEVKLTRGQLKRSHGFEEVIAILENATGIDIECEQRPSNLEELVIVFPVFLQTNENEYTSVAYTAREILGGLALLFGGNAVERNGKVYLTLADRSGSSMTKVFTEDAYLECIVSRKAYAPAPIKLSYQNYAHQKGDTAWLYYTSGEKKTATISTEPPSSELNYPDTLYELQIECDWIAYSLLDINLFLGNPWTGAAGAYRPFEAEFCGYHPYLAAGNDITVIDEQGNQQQVFCDNVTYEWDGGMSIKVSSSFEITDGTGGVTSTITSSTAAGGMTAQQIGQQNEVVAFKSIYTNYVEANDAKIKHIESIGITTENLDASVANIGTLNANDAIIKNIFSESIISDNAILGVLQTNIVNADVIKSATAEFGYITVDEANIKYATVEGLRAVEIQVAGKISADEADLKYANITFGNIDTANINKANIGLLFNEVGLIDRATIVNGHITGYLDSVEVNADKITAGTLTTDRLVIRGSTDSIVYELNNITGALQSSSVDTINGEVITPRTINADKVIAGSITTTELDVAQIFADTAVIQQIFAQDITATGTITGATLKGVEAWIDKGYIAGFSIEDNRLRSVYSDFESEYITALARDKIWVTKSSTNRKNSTDITIEPEGIVLMHTENNGIKNTIYISPENGLEFGYDKDLMKINKGEINFSNGAIRGTNNTYGFYIQPDTDRTGQLGDAAYYFKKGYISELHTDKLKFKETNYGVEIGTTSSGGSAGVRIGDLSGGNGSYTYITNNCVAQHNLRVVGNLSVEGVLTLSKKIASAVTMCRTSNYTISSTTEVVILLNKTNENSDTDVFNPSNGILIIKKSGYYLISGAAVMSATGNLANVKYLRIRDTSNNNMELVSVASRGIGTWQSFVIPPMLVHLSANATLALCYQDQAGNGTIYGNKATTYMTVTKMQ